MRTRLLLPALLVLLSACGGSLDLKGSAWLKPGKGLDGGRVYEFGADGSLTRTSGYKAGEDGKWSRDGRTMSSTERGAWSLEGNALTMTYASDLTFTETITANTGDTFSSKSKSGKDRTFYRVKKLEGGSVQPLTGIK